MEFAVIEMISRIRAQTFKDRMAETLSVAQGA